MINKKLKYAFNFCKSVDADDYTRIALPRNMDGSSVNTDIPCNENNSYKSVLIILILRQYFMKIN